MAKCRICLAENSAEAQRCESCGAWLDAPTSEHGESTSKPASAEPANGLADSPADPLEAAIVDLVRRNRKIDAIKRYREATGKGLKESKEAVEEIARRFGVAGGASGGIGCGASILAAAAFLGGMIVVAVPLF